MGDKEKELDYLLGLDDKPPAPPRTDTDQLRARLAAIGQKYRRKGSDKAVDKEFGIDVQE